MGFAIGFGTTEVGLWVLDIVVTNFPFVGVLLDLAARVLLPLATLGLLFSAAVALGAFGPANAHLTQLLLGDRLSWGFPRWQSAGHRGGPTVALRARGRVVACRGASPLGPCL
jgi:hypothetical protein